MTLKLSLGVGLPTVSSLSDHTIMASQMNLDVGHGHGPSGFLLSFLVFILIYAFANGGFMGLIRDTVEGRALTFQSFVQQGKRYFGRFLALELIITVFLLIFGGIAAFGFGLLGIALFTFLYLWLRSLFVYVECTIVVDNVPLMESFERARGYFRNRTPDTLTIIVAIIGVSLILALVLNSLWNPLVFLLILVIYDYVLTGFQLALMMSLYEIRKNGAI